MVGINCICPGRGGGMGKFNCIWCESAHSEIKTQPFLIILSVYVKGK